MYKQSSSGSSSTNEIVDVQNIKIHTVRARARLFFGGAWHSAEPHSLNNNSY
jgi:hypothetical protein